MIYRLLFDAAAQTLIEFGENPRWLGGRIGVTTVLHTWGQTLNQHLHVHCLVSGGALGPDGRWIHPRRGFLFPVKALSTVFRGKFIAALKHAFDCGALTLAGATAALLEPGPHPAPPADRRTSQSRARSSTRAALTRFSASAIVSRIAIDPPTSIRAPHASRIPHPLRAPRLNRAICNTFESQTPSH